MDLTIGEVARRAGVAPTALRFYEQIGLLPEPGRVAGKRRYDVTVLARLEVIRMCKTAGFSLDEMAILFADDGAGRAASRDLARAKLAEIDERIRALEDARRVIEWGLTCTCPSIATCTCGIHREKPSGSAGSGLP